MTRLWAGQGGIAIEWPQNGGSAFVAFDRVGHHINQNQLDTTPHLVRLVGFFSETILVQVDGDEYYITFENGSICDILEGPSRKTAWRFALRTDAAALPQFWQPIPKSGFHDIFGLVKIGRRRVDGDILALVKNLRFIKEVLGLARGQKEIST